MNLPPLTLPQIEQMYQDGALSEFERIDLVEKWVARQKRAMNAASAAAKAANDKAANDRIAAECEARATWNVWVD